MSQKREIACDRCGKGILNLDRCGLNVAKEVSAKLLYYPVGAPRSYGDQRIDLCEECAEKFVNFMEGQDEL